MNSISKKAFLSVFMVALSGVAHCAEESIVLDTQSFGTMIPVGAIATAQGTKVWRDIDKTRFELFKDACGNAVAAVRQKASNMVAPVCQRADKVVASARATRPAQFVEVKVAQYPKTAKAVAGTIVGAAVVGAVYKAANSERGQKVRARISESAAYKSVANFVEKHKEILVGTAVVAAAAVGGKRVLLPKVNQWLAQAAC